MKSLFLLLLLLAVHLLPAQHTFSIVALDSITGEIGSAGATCLDKRNIAGGALIISDVLPGRGAIHTQALWTPANQQNARLQMLQGKSPQQVLDWLFANDAGANPSVRQYGIVDFDSAGHPRSAAFTGLNCLDYKNHLTGPGYSIQGNILLGQSVLDSMESGFLRTQGSLAERLMAAMQGANVPGADSRCGPEGVSSLSAFLRVAQPGDPINALSLELLVDFTPLGEEPIDSLQVLFDAWQTSTAIEAPPLSALKVRVFPNPFADEVNLNIEGAKAVTYYLKIFSLSGQEVLSREFKETSLTLNKKDLGTAGVYWYRLSAEGVKAVTGPLWVQ